MYNMYIIRMIKLTPLPCHAILGQFRRYGKMSTEKNEKEIRQVNFRIDQASADAFRSFCTANGMNQAQGFDHLIQDIGCSFFVFRH